MRKGNFKKKSAVSNEKKNFEFQTKPHRFQLKRTGLKQKKEAVSIAKKVNLQFQKKLTTKQLLEAKPKDITDFK